MTKVFLLLSVAALWTSACLGQNACSYKRIFEGDEDPCFESATSPPPDVAAAILNTAEEKDTFDDPRKTSHADENIREWVSCPRIVA